MSQLTLAPTDDDADADRVPISPEEAFIMVMGPIYKKIRLLLLHKM